jgi:hypothetical protein
VTRGPVDRTIRSVGNIAYDEAGLRDITLRYGGWIEALFVNTTAATVRTGEPLFRIYSPDLYNAELNYIVARRNEGTDDGPLTQAARIRLELLDVPDDFIAALAQSGKADRTYTYRAPAAGIVTQKPVVVGRRVEAGELIYQLASLDPVWVVAQFYDEDAPFIHVGDSVTIRPSFGSAPAATGKIAVLEPQLADATRTLMARIVLANPDGHFRPGAYVDVNLNAHIADDAVLVPATAVLRSGEHNTVFIALDGGRFEPRGITLGARTADDRYQVLTGLHPGDRVVVSGQFMLDSESQLREGIQKMLKAGDNSDVAAVPAAPPPVTPAHDQLSALALTAADAAHALGQDDLSAYQKLLPALQTQLHAYLDHLPAGQTSPLATSILLADHGDLKTARAGFERFSTALADIVRANPAIRAQLHVFECPMSPVLGTGRWLQRDNTLLNPFYGSAMPGCGEELK